MSPGATSDGACRITNTTAPIFAAIVMKSATRYVKKHEGSSSLSYSDNQATGRWQPASHSLTNVVLPKPVGAEVRASLRPEERSSFNRSIRWRRRTILAQGGGINSFVPRRSTIEPLSDRNSCLIGSRSKRGTELCVGKSSRLGWTVYG